ncbi:MAG TPA: hypothetical protein VK587_09760 [bacterium]|nr:hypothetical protein [bacterium]
MSPASKNLEQRLAVLERTITAANERIQLLEARQRRTARWWSLALGAAVAVAISWSVSAPARGAGTPGSSSTTLYAPVTVEDRQTHHVILTIDDSALVLRDHLNNKTVEIGTTTAGVGAVAVYNGSRATQSSLVDLLSSTQNGGMLSILSAGGREVASLQAGSGGDGSFALRRGNGDRLVTTGVTAAGQGYVSAWTHGNTTGILIGEPSVIVGPKP